MTRRKSAKQIIGTLICQFVRWRGGKHKWVDGACSRCERKQAVRKAKATP